MSLLLPALQVSHRAITIHGNYHLWIRALLTFPLTMGAAMKRKWSSSTWLHLRNWRSWGSETNASRTWRRRSWLAWWNWKRLSLEQTVSQGLRERRTVRSTWRIAQSWENWRFVTGPFQTIPSVQLKTFRPWQCLKWPLWCQQILATASATLHWSWRVWFSRQWWCIDLPSLKAVVLGGHAFQYCSRVVFESGSFSVSWQNRLAWIAVHSSGESILRVP